MLSKRRMGGIVRSMAGTAAMVTLTLAVAAAQASSHSDAPISKQDPQTNLTDVYAFIGTKYDDADTKVLNVIVNVRPFCEPGDGVIYDRFADDTRYSIHIANPSNGQTAVRYDFFFSPVNTGYLNVNTILSYGLGTEVGPIVDVGDNRQNYTQMYSVTRIMGNTSTELGDDLLVPPPNVGSNVTPSYNGPDGFAISGAGSFAELDVYTQQSIHDLRGGLAAFAGLRDDSFFGDVPGISDLLNARILDNNGSLADGLGRDGNGVDGFKGYNVLTFALQIPVSALPSFNYTSAFFGPQQGVGVYATVSHRRFRFLTQSGNLFGFGPFVQVNRLANPLFNEVLVPHFAKDEYNRRSPTQDVANFTPFAANPELAALINAVFQTSFVTTGRDDLVNVYIPDVIRVNTTTDPVPLPGQPGFHRLGFIGGDTTNGVSSGWPNGRRLGDDSVDIALTAIASGPSYQAITVVGDNVPENDIAYHAVFPYAATPHSGTKNRKDPAP